MLSRAAQSVATQTYRDFVWVVVNDGGNREEVDKIVGDYRGSVPDILVVHHEVNRGMEAASNSGIAACQSEYVVVHDDDDTWDPEFLEKTVSFLQFNPQNHFGGVVTAITHVDEVMTDKEVVVRGRKPWHPSHGRYPSGAVQLSDLCVVNQFAPIAFLFKRSAYDEIGGFDESLPVLGDWEFNLRFASRYDIAALPEFLANYHHRPASSNAYGNSVLAGRLSHVSYDAILRNRIIRAGSQDRYKVVAPLVASGRNALQLKEHCSGVVLIADRLLQHAAPIAKKLRAGKRALASWLRR